jgi:hypothetical protein
MSAFPRSHVDLLDGPLPAAHDGDAERPVPVDRRVVQPPTAVTSGARRTARLNAGRCCRRGPMEVDSLRSRLIPERLKEREAVHTSSPLGPATALSPKAHSFRSNHVLSAEPVPRVQR